MKGILSRIYITVYYTRNVQGCYIKRLLIMPVLGTYATCRHLNGKNRSRKAPG